MSSRVLVIDDSPMLLQLSVNALKAGGLDAVGANNLAELETRLSEGAYALVLCDINMPEAFGDDVLEYLRNQRKLDAKLLLYSDVALDELESRAKNAGADGWFSKGRPVEEMVEHVRGVLAPPPAAAAAAAKPAAEGGRKKRVLIVDDSAVTMGLLAADLDAKGFEVHTADAADKATRIILKKQTRPDLVLLDVNMPNVNGEQLCRFIKGNALFKGIKVLLCSGENPEELRRICRESGADGFVTKDSVLGNKVAKELD